MAKGTDEAELSGTPAPGDFDLQAWIEGATGNRRAVTLYSDLAANADVDVLAARIDEARKTGASVDELRDLEAQRKAAAQRVIDSAVDFVVEGLTGDGIRRITETFGDDVTDDDKALAVLARQIVQPEGITVEFLRLMQERLPSQFARLLQTATQATQEFTGVTAPFSRRS